METQDWRRILDETDWSGLSHAYGTAVDTPGHLRALMAGAPEERRAAADHLVSAIVHQGTPWPATLPAISVVLGMLQDPELAASIQPSREAMLDVLAEIKELLDLLSDDWPGVEQMAAKAPEARAAVVDWIAFEDEALLNAYYAQDMLELRGLEPIIHACSERRT